MSIVISRRLKQSFALGTALAVGAAIATTSFASDASTGHATSGAGRAPANVATDGRVAIVQAVPMSSVTVMVDGKTVTSGLAGGKVLGPLQLSAGTHQVQFTDSSGKVVTSTVTVKAGDNSDVVFHRPASVQGAPIVSVYPSPMKALGPGKAGVLLAHTATTAPADVRVDGKTVFTDIANGEYAEADVPAGTHEVALYPAGVTTAPILGPLKVTLKAGTFTAVYAVGNPKTNSMNVIVRTTKVGTSSSAPTSIDTGSAGLVSSVHVYTFHTP